jgi:hypothetical protein
MGSVYTNKCRLTGGAFTQATTLLQDHLAQILTASANTSRSPRSSLSLMANCKPPRVRRLQDEVSSLSIDPTATTTSKAARGTSKLSQRQSAFPSTTCGGPGVALLLYKFIDAFRNMPSLNSDPDAGHYCCETCCELAPHIPEDSMDPHGPTRSRDKRRF